MSKSVEFVINKINLFRTTWRDAAVEVPFAGMTLTQFETATNPALDLENEIEVLELQLKRKKSERADINQAALDLLELVVNAVKGTPGFGTNSPMYGNLGYIRKQDRKTGKTNKNKKTENPASPA